MSDGIGPRGAALRIRGTEHGRGSALSRPGSGAMAVGLYGQEQVEACRHAEEAPSFLPAEVVPDAPPPEPAGLSDGWIEIALSTGHRMCCRSAPLGGRTDT